MTTKEVISLLLSFGAVDCTFLSTENRNAISGMAFIRYNGGSLHFIKDSNGPWLFQFRDGIIKYWTSKGMWQSVEDGLSLESIILLYKDSFNYEVA